MSAIDHYVDRYSPKIPPAARPIVSDMKPWSEKGCENRLEKLLQEAQSKQDVDKFFAELFAWVQKMTDNGWCAFAEMSFDALMQAWDRLDMDAKLTAKFEAREDWF